MGSHSHLNPCFPKGEQLAVAAGLGIWNVVQPAALGSAHRHSVPFRPGSRVIAMLQLPGLQVLLSFL